MRTALGEVQTPRRAASSGVIPGMNDSLEDAIAVCQHSLSQAMEGMVPDPVVVNVLHKLALEILAQTSQGTPTLTCRVEWHEGCHCHGNDRSEDFDVNTVEDMARELAGNNHVEDGDLGNVYYRVPLSEAEYDQLKARYRVWRDYYTKGNALIDYGNKLTKELRSAGNSLKYAQEKLNQEAQDLTPEAISRRNAEIEALSARERGLRAAQATAVSDYKVYEGKRP